MRMGRSTNAKTACLLAKGSCYGPTPSVSVGPVMGENVLEGNGLQMDGPPPDSGTDGGTNEKIDHH